MGEYGRERERERERERVREAGLHHTIGGVWEREIEGEREPGLHHTIGGVWERERERERGRERSTHGDRFDPLPATAARAKQGAHKRREMS